MNSWFKSKKNAPPPLQEKVLIFTPDMELIYQDLIKKASPFTMTSVERMYSLCKAMEYVVKNQIPGDFVECGVWKGGSTYLVLLLLDHFKDYSRKIHLFDTFEGMTPPTEKDVSIFGENAKEALDKEKRSEESDIWAYAPLESVQKLLNSTNYPKEKIHYHVGRVEDTIPNAKYEMISVLRLDTDWYESTLHELNHLYPKVTSHGVVIIDDYGHWQGAKKAVDEFFADKAVLLNRIDYTGRIGIKL